jgi:hypothetical protein
VSALPSRVIGLVAGALSVAGCANPGLVRRPSTPTERALRLPRAAVCDRARWDARTISVERFGAAGGGEGDDYDALQRAAAYVSAHPGVTLVFPPGVYRIGRHIEPGGDARHVEIRGGRDFHIVGCNATISVDGDFRRRAGAATGTPGARVSADDAVTPFAFADCERFSLEGFELDGNAQRMRRDPEVVEGSGMGVSTAGCSDYTIAGMDIHHFAVDGLYLGGRARADRRALISGVTSAHNGRQGMSVIQLREGLVRGSSFLDNGRPGGAYEGHAPRAGVAIEPNTAPPGADTLTGDIAFEGCRFEHNKGSQIAASYRALTGEVRISDAVVTADRDSSRYAVILAVRQGVLERSRIDTARGAVFPAWGDGGRGDDHATYPMVHTTLRDNVIWTEGAGIMDAFAEQSVVIERNLIAGRHQGPAETFMPYLASPACSFRDNTVVLPRQAYRPYDVARGLRYHHAVMLEVGASSGNRFVTDMDPGAGAQFLVVYGSAAVSGDLFASAPAVAPCAGCNVVGPYSSRGLE